MNYIIKIIHLVGRLLFDLSSSIIGPKVREKVHYKDTYINEVKVRTYSFESTRPCAAIIFYHGGGWIIGSIKSYHNIMKYLCMKIRCVIISVDYRLSPECKYPTAIEDAVKVCSYVFDHGFSLSIDTNKVIIMGDSAGGNLAAVTAQKMLEIGNKPLAQALIYPIVEVDNMDRGYMNGDRLFIKLLKFIGYLILKYCLYQYLPNRNIDKSLLVPNPSKQSAIDTLIISASVDPLTDSIKQYAKNIKEIGYDVDYQFYDRTLHGFVNFAGINKTSVLALNNIANFILSKINT